MIFFTDGSGNGGYGFIRVNALEELDAGDVYKQIYRIPPTDKCTNNRAELLGIIMALENAALENIAHVTHKIISDSMIAIRTLTEWLPNRLKKGTQGQLQNIDLLMRAHALLQTVRVEFRHVNSHQKAIVGGAEYYYYKGNNMIDELIM